MVQNMANYSLCQVSASLTHFHNKLKDYCQLKPTGAQMAEKLHQLPIRTHKHAAVFCKVLEMFNA